MSDDFAALVNFGGVARLFPLPNLVLFPQVVQPLHIFEARYRQMTADALAGDRLIAMVLLRPGWEADYAGRPAVYPVACLGQVVAEQRLKDGRFNILLRGLGRIRLGEEVATGKAYRSARAELLADTDVPGPETDRKLRRRLARAVPTWFAGQKAALEQFRNLLKSGPPLGALADITAYALPLDVAAKQELLEMRDVEERMRRVLGHMEAHPPAQPAAAPQPKFPPDFSAN